MKKNISIQMTLIFFCLIFSQNTLKALSSDFPDLYDVKLSIKDQWLGGVFDLYSPVGKDFSFNDDIKIKYLVKRKIKKQGNFLFASLLISDQGSFPLSRQGNVSLKRNLDNGGFEYYTLILRDEENCYLRMRPQGKRTVWDIYLFGYHLYSDLVIPIPFHQAIFLRFEDIVQLSRKAVDWDMLLYKTKSPSHSRLQKLAKTIKSKLNDLSDNDDGAIDEKGRWVFIEDGKVQNKNPGLNCSGFAKWVVDGFYRKLTGKNMNIERLKFQDPAVRGSRWTRSQEREYDLYFGLDWTRNMAKEYHSTLSTEFIKAHREAFDVRDVSLLHYTEDVGYKIDQLYLALFYLAQKDQGHIYLGAISRSWNQNPQLLCYFHVVVLIPYFDAKGHFQVDLLERQEKNKINSLKYRYSGQYIHLVRIDAGSDYDYTIPALNE